MNTRATPSSTPAPPKVLNVVTLGDSLAYGAGDETDRGIAGRLEKELTRRGFESVDATNLGINGAQTSDLLARLRSQSVRSAIAEADAVILSIGANDLFRSPEARQQTLTAPFEVAEQILGRITQIVGEVHEINPRARVLLLGGYNPVPTHQYAAMIEQYLKLWDVRLAGAFEHDRRVTVIRMSDIVVPERLSRHDSFHPGGEAYQKAAERIASVLVRV